MRVLLDTHVFLWALIDSPRLSPAARETLNTATEVYVSAASIWEIAIKTRLGRLECDLSEVIDSIPRSGCIELPVSARHAAAVAELPLHHRDPFCRLLIAQAMTEPLILLTADSTLTQYSDLIRPV